MKFQIYYAAFATLFSCCLIIAYVWHVLDSIVRAADAIDADDEDDEEDGKEGK